MAGVPNVPTGLPYGGRSKLEAAQAAVPVPTSDPAAPAPSSAPQPGGGGLAAALAAASSTAPPSGGFTTPGDPSAAPTIGLPMGPGPGLGSLPPAGPPRTPTADDWRVAGELPKLEQLASLPGASDAFKNYVRQLRASLPAGVSQQAYVQRMVNGGS